MKKRKRSVPCFILVVIWLRHRAEPVPKLEGTYFSDSVWSCEKKLNRTEFKSLMRKQLRKSVFREEITQIVLFLSHMILLFQYISKLGQLIYHVTTILWLGEFVDLQLYAAQYTQSRIGWSFLRCAVDSAGTISIFFQIRLVKCKLIWILRKSLSFHCFKLSVVSWNLKIPSPVYLYILPAVIVTFEEIFSPNLESNVWCTFCPSHWMVYRNRQQGVWW